MTIKGKLMSKVGYECSCQVTGDDLAKIEEILSDALSRSMGKQFNDLEFAAYSSSKGGGIEICVQQEVFDFDQSVDLEELLIEYVKSLIPDGSPEQKAEYEEAKARVMRIAERIQKL